MICRDKPFKCPCTGQITRACDCNQGRLPCACEKAPMGLPRVLVGVACGVALAVGVIMLTGCEVTSKGNPYPNGQFQGNVEHWDTRTWDHCTDVAIKVVGSVVRQHPPGYFTDDRIKAGLKQVFEYCLAENGRTI